MESSSPEFLFLQMLSVAVYGGVAGFRLWKQHRKQKLFVVLSTRKIGLTTALKKVKESMEGKVIVVDRDDIIESQSDEVKTKLLGLMNERKDAFDLLFYPLVKAHLKNCVRIFKGQPIVLFVNDEYLIKYLKVPNKNVLSLVPTVSMFQKLMDSYKGKNEDGALKALITSREELIVSGFKKVLLKNWNELESILNKILAVRK